MTPRLLLCTTNGTGLGHLTRTMAIARRLPDRWTPVIFSLSQAVPVVRQQGFACEFLPSAGYAGLDRGDWNLLYERRLGELLFEYDPAVVAFDGTYPYVGLFAQMPAHRQRRFVWVRRAMWKPGLGRESLGRARLFDRIIEPGEIAEDADQGGTVAQRQQAIRVGPVLATEPDELHPRPTARTRLGLEADATWALVQLGAGAINDTSTLIGAALAGLSEVPGVRIALAESTIAQRRTDVPQGVRSLQRYPLAPDLAAFDLAVTAAGYNSVHELAAAGVPTIFAPNRDTQLDDQLARARYLAQQDAARCWDDGTLEGFRTQLATLLDPSTRAKVGQRARSLVTAGGARQAADALVEGLTP